MNWFSPSFQKSLFAPDSQEATPMPSVTRYPQLVLVGILMLACILAFAPLYPRMPEAGLDPSWMLAMNQAVAQGSVFGRDIVFTFGPYSALFTQAYHPATYSRTLAIGLLLGLCYGAMLLMTLRKQGNGWHWLYAGFLLFANSRDALFFSYPLLVTLIACAASLPDKDPRHFSFSPHTRAIYLLAIALLGVLPIIKGSFLPLSVLAALVGCTLFWLRGERTFALLFIALPLIAMIVLWQMAGQPISALPDFFISMAPIISGFSEAMSVNGFFGELVAFIAVAILILASILRDARNAFAHKMAIMSCVGLFLYISFKAGFVRHDQHALAAGSALVLAALAVNASRIIRISTPIIVFSFISFLAIHYHYVWHGAEANVSPISSVISREPLGRQLDTLFAQRLAKTNMKWKIPLLDGTTDIYPFDQAALIASGNNWLPRPIPQSYSVYTPALARINEAHLRGSTAPDNVVFRIETIDQRFPSLEDGLSWPSLFSHYAISAVDKNFAYLKKRPAPLPTTKTVAMQGTYRLGNQVALPQGDHIFFAEIDVSPSVLGQIAKILYKPTPLTITANLADGQSKTYRFIPSMARAGFVISPLIKTTTDFVHLATGPFHLLADNRVTSIRIVPEGAESLFWKKEYSLSVFVLDTTPSQK
jgi:hypothetical protein